MVIAKRLESEEESGGILVSDVVRQAVAGKDFEFEDRGEVELTGFERPVQAWTVSRDSRGAACCAHRTDRRSQRL